MVTHPLTRVSFDAPAKDINAYFDTIDTSGDGYINYNEFKKALASKALAAAKASRPPLKKKNSTGVKPPTREASGLMYKVRPCHDYTYHLPNPLLSIHVCLCVR